MRPCLPAILRAPGRLGHPFALPGYGRFFGLRSLLAVSSVASGRIEFVSQCLGHRTSTDYLFTSSCSPPRVATAQLLSVTRREAPPVRDLHPLCTLTLKRTSAGLWPAVSPTSSRQGERCEQNTPVFKSSVPAHAQQAGGLRYGRPEACATGWRKTKFSQLRRSGMFWAA